MDKRVLRERMRRKKRQMMIRHYTKIGLCVIGMILAVVFVVRGIIIPIAHHVAGGGSSDQTVQAQADTEEVQANSDAAVRQPLKGKSDTDKIAAMTAGWHEDANGKWYQNTDGTYFSNGFQDIDGVTYSFDENGYIQTGWVEKGVKDYYFNEDGSYDPSKVRPMLALTFDDGPGQYTDELLDCLEQNNAHATFFMLGQNVSAYPDAPKRMLELGCEVGSHSWDHTQLTTIDLDAVAKQFSDTDDALIQACGQAASVARAPYGDGNSDIYNTVNKPFFMWSLDTEDWKLMDADADYNAVMNGDLTDGTIILMHDIHEPSVKAALRLIPKHLNTTRFSCYLVNDSNYYLYFSYLSRDDEGWRTRYAGMVEPNIQVMLEEFGQEDVNSLERICIQYIAFKKDKHFSLKSPVAVEYRLDTTKFYKLHTFRESLYFDEPSWTLDIVKNDMPVRPVVFDASDLEKAMKMKKSANMPLRKPVVKHAEKTAIVEVDLHASALDTTAGLTSSEILDYQLGKVRETLDQYRHAKGRKIVFIHGKGEGVLRNALLKEIRDKYKNCSCQDASFREYGFGATMVTVH